MTKKKVVLAKRFKCPFFSNEQAVECKMDRQKGIGSLNCRLCAASYQMPIHHLHEPIDVFSEWLDDCEAAERQNSGLPLTHDEDSRGALRNRDVAGQFDDDDDDDDSIAEPSGLHQSTTSAGLLSTSAASSDHRGKNSAVTVEKKRQAQPATIAALGLESSDSDDDDSNDEA